MESQKPESTNDDPSLQQCAGPSGELGDDALDDVVGGLPPVLLPQMLLLESMNAKMNAALALARKPLAPVETQSKADFRL